LRKTKTDYVTPAKAGVQSEKDGFPLSREWQILFPQQELIKIFHFHAPSLETIILRTHPRGTLEGA